MGKPLAILPSLTRQASILCITLAILSANAYAVDYYWNAATGQWETPANWELNSAGSGIPATVPPTSGDYVYIDNDGTATIGTGVTGLANWLHVGRDGTGTLSLTDGGKATAAGYIIIGWMPDSEGTVTVNGIGSELNAGGPLYVCVGGTGNLSLTGGGKATVGGAIIIGSAAVANSEGNVTVDGVGSELNAGTGLAVGGGGTGNLSLTGGGKATAGSGIVIGDETGSKGSVLVGNGSTLFSPNVYVGGNNFGVGGTGLLAGTGTVTTTGVTGVQVYSTGTLSPGDTEGAIGTLTITGNLDLRGGSTLLIDLGAGNTADKIAVSGTVSHDATNSIIDLSTWAVGTFSLMTAAGGIDKDKFTVTGFGSRQSATLDTSTASALILTTTSNNLNLTWTGTNGNWNITADNNWKDASSNPEIFNPDDYVIFDNTGTTKTITVGGTGVQVAGMKITGGDYTFSGGNITGLEPVSTGQIVSGKLEVTGGSVTFNNAVNFVNNVEIDNGGAVTVNGTGSELHSDAILIVGSSGTGNLSLTNGGKVTAASGIRIGNQAGSEGTVTVDGNSVLENTAGQLWVGSYGTGNLSLTNGGKATSAGRIFIGNETNSEGTVTVSGAGSELRTSSDLAVGTYGTGNLHITGGGKATATDDIIIGFGTSEGTVTVDGNNSETTAKRLFVGTHSKGNLSLTNGGKATATNNIFIGYQASSEGTVLVGNDSTLSGPNVYVGGGDLTARGTGLLTGTGTVTTTGADGVKVWNTGTLSPGDAVGAIGTLTINGNLDLQSGSTLAVDVNRSTGASDCVDVNGNVTIAVGAKLNINVVNEVGAFNEFLLMDANNIAGEFELFGAWKDDFESDIRGGNKYYVLWTQVTPEFADIIDPLATSNALQIAVAVDTIGKTGGIDDLYDALAGMPKGDAKALADAFAQLHGEVFASNKEAAAQLQRRFLLQLPSAQDRFLCDELCVGGWNRWATLTGDWRARKNIGLYSGYDLRMAGIAVGFDRHIDRNTLVGLAFGYDNAFQDFRTIRSQNTMDSFRTVLYKGWWDGNRFANAYAGYTRNEHQTRRNID
ncbi:MAG: hypothetical protein FWE95_09895, partial [Planctomycetaceae bacterium]|nr:hypothetical protein [Planctomycetaceae bacterium]